ncbi:class I SAM-dependent methyltransferase [Algoriphagus halophytocola]|uniref:Class I SAM-dependent methyltransferase n=1 Tax=Algoriphagus halophytocola TaxID=2991499 RepID=A0ABY6MBT3_9BACT|nr:class I SAM-dependent methyltransferase [Algoriphagus sp. TR-M5]UZD21098.1 class I SAM-dependent methyltransferase [Algoriphagus sp. TR-M5]
MKDQYSLLAPWYSSLVKFIFGQKLKEAKLCFLDDAKSKRVLIIGGGDGLDYAEIEADISGEYWELSDSMLKKAKANLQFSQLDFRLGNFEAGKKSDEVWLHFVLDTLPDEAIESLLEEIKLALKAGGRIVFADFFRPKNYRQKFLNQVMITFFRLVAGHHRKDLPDYSGFFSKKGFSKTEEQRFMEGWVKAQVWRLK